MAKSLSLSHKIYIETNYDMSFLVATILKVLARFGAATLHVWAQESLVTGGGALVSHRGR